MQGVVQNLTGLTNIYNIKTDDSGLIDLPIDKIILFSYKKRRGNPEGHSLLKDCYQPWVYKKTIESYEAVGVAKDLGGVPVVFADATWLAKAQADPTSDEGKVLETLQTYCENLHSGEQTYMMMPMSYNDMGKPLFEQFRFGDGIPHPVAGSVEHHLPFDLVLHSHVCLLCATNQLRIEYNTYGRYATAWLLLLTNRSSCRYC